MEEPEKPWWKDGRFVIRTIVEIASKFLPFLF